MYEYDIWLLISSRSTLSLTAWSLESLERNNRNLMAFPTHPAFDNSHARASTKPIDDAMYLTQSGVPCTKSASKPNETPATGSNFSKAVILVFSSISISRIYLRPLVNTCLVPELLDDLSRVACHHIPLQQLHKGLPSKPSIEPQSNFARRISAFSSSRTAPYSFPANCVRSL